MNDAMKTLLEEHIRRGREHTKGEAQRIARIGQLHARAIFWDSNGDVPPKLKEEVQQVLDAEAKST